MAESYSPDRDVGEAFGAWFDGEGGWRLKSVDFFSTMSDGVRGVVAKQARIARDSDCHSLFAHREGENEDEKEGEKSGRGDRQMAPCAGCPCSTAALHAHSRERPCCVSGRL